MAFKIGGTLGKIANKVKKMDAGDVALGVATGGLSTVYDAVSGKDQSIKDQAVKGLKGVFDTPKADIKAADPNNYVTQTNELLNPVADQYTKFGETSAVTSNVDPAFRQYQMQLAQQLQAQANGQGPSLAQMQLQQATDQSLNQSLGMIRSAQGQNGALAARSAALAGSQQLGGLGLQSGMLRLQEQRQAQAALGDLANQGRAGDLTTNAQGMEAQAQTQRNRLAGIQGLEGVRTTQAGVQGNVYSAQNGAQVADSTQDSALKAQRQNQILGGLTTLATAGLGSLAGGSTSLVQKK